MATDTIILSALLFGDASRAHHLAVLIMMQLLRRQRVPPLKDGAKKADLPLAVDTHVTRVGLAGSGGHGKPKERAKAKEKARNKGAPDQVRRCPGTLGQA